MAKNTYMLLSNGSEVIVHDIMRKYLKVGDWYTCPYTDTDTVIKRIFKI